MKRLAILAVFLLVFSACGGGSDDSDDGNQAQEEPAASPSPTVEDEPEDGDDAGNAACLEAPPAKTKLALTQVDVQFKPRKLEVPAGEKVTIVVSNKGALEHTFTSDVLECSTGFLAGSTKARVTFTMPDKAVPFYCQPHKPTMNGKLVPV